MDKATLIDKLAFRAGLSKTQTQKAVDELLDLIADTLDNGEIIDLGGFGVFDVEVLPDSVLSNPHTGQISTTKPKKRVRFKAGSELAGEIS